MPFTWSLSHVPMTSFFSYLSSLTVLSLVLFSILFSTLSWIWFLTLSLTVLFHSDFFIVTAASNLIFNSSAYPGGTVVFLPNKTVKHLQSGARGGSKSNFWFVFLWHGVSRACALFMTVFSCLHYQPVIFKR